jgi:hypothetical protein
MDLQNAQARDARSGPTHAADPVGGTTLPAVLRAGASGERVAALRERAATAAGLVRPVRLPGATSSAAPTRVAAAAGER